MSYKQFKNCGVYNKTLYGDNIIIRPIMTGLTLKDPYRPNYNDMRVTPLVTTTNLDYKSLQKAYPQEQIN